MKALRLRQVLEKLIEQDWAVFIWGAPGIGKSSIIRQLAADRKMPLIDLRAPLLDPTDLRGLPVVKDGVAKWCSPDFLPKEGSEPGILFLDEINAAPPLVQTAMYQLVLDRKVGEYTLPDGWKIIAAGNRQKDRAVTFKMSSALSNRFIHLNLDVDADNWISWTIDNDVHPLVTAFIRFRPELIHTEPAQNEVFASPRSWEMLSDVLKAFEGTDSASDFVSGIIGEDPAIEFLNFMSSAVDQAELDALLADPEKAPIPDKLDKLWVLVSYLANHAKDKMMSEASGRLLDRLPPEFAVILCRDILKVNPMFIKDKNYLGFVKKHSDLFR